ASAENNLGLALLHAGRYGEAEQHFARALSILEATGHARSDHGANLLNNLAALALYRGDLPRAEAFFARALEARQALGGESAAMSGLLSNYGRVLTLRHRLQQAGAALARAEELSVRYTGADSVDTALVRLAAFDHALAGADRQRAGVLLQQTRSVLEEKLGAEHPYSARAVQAS